MLKTSLLPHQVATKEFVATKKFIFDMSLPGTGKSLSALASVIDSGLKAVVVCPPHLVNNWMQECIKHTTLKPTPRLLKYNSDFDVFIVPYTQVAKSEDIFKNTQFVICDESHYISNLSAKRTQALHSLLYKYIPQYLMLMSGTIMRNRVSELYSPLVLLGLGKTVQPKIIDKYKSFYLYCNRFTNVRSTPFGTQYSGSKNVDELRKYLVPYAIKHKEDVLNLPELCETKVVVDYKDDPELLKAFEEFQCHGVNANIIAKTKSAEAKAPFTADYVMSLIDQDCGPIVVFSDHRKSISIIELELSKKRVRSITGETSMDKRTEYVKMLNSGQLDALICSIGSSSSGITLTGSNRMIFNDVPFTPGDLSQAKKRIHRLSQEKPCQITYVVGSSVDEKIINMLNSKTKTINKVLGGI